MAKNSGQAKSITKRVRFLGSARSGTAEAWAMRITSSMLLVLSIAFVAVIMSLLGKDYAAVRAELRHPLPVILLAFFILACIYHMKLGMQSIIDDYVHHAHLKEWSLIANFVFCLSIGLASVYALLRLSLA
ncbi:MAG: succinate dehydrogenase, hydrophobic membrane anchor protein [Methylocapsa sp.]|nr:succinate dehydrogenase, hydrophobic membrane anchor protein [Methylocapsa sp.]